MNGRAEHNPLPCERRRNVARSGGALRADRAYVGDGADLTATLALLAENQRATGLEPTARTAAIGALRATLRQRDDETRYREELDIVAEAGRTFGGGYARQRGALMFGTGTGAAPVVARTCSSRLPPRTSAP